MKAFRLVFALVALTVTSACTADGNSPTGPSSASFDTGMGSPGRCNDPTICP